MKKIKSLWENKRIRILLILVIVIFLLIITFIPHGLLSTIKNLIRPEEYGITKELKNYDENTGIYYFLITITNPDGLEKVENITTNQIIYCKGRTKLGIDYQVEDNTTYNFKITLSDGQVKNEQVYFGRQRMGIDTYKKLQNNDVYVNTPNLDGYVKENTRYLRYDNDKEVLQPSYWTTDMYPIDWYNYKEHKWANIYVESEGVENYYVWIPRYCYKKDNNNSVSGNERTDVKFIDVYNNYKDPVTGAETKWETLKEQGYVVPEAFEWGQFHEISISGYWISKYETSDLQQYTLEFDLTSGGKVFKVSNLKANTSKEIAKYTYAINQEIVHESTEVEDYIFTDTILNEMNSVNITALNSDGEIIGSMTKKMELIDANKPDFTGFNTKEQDDEGNKLPVPYYVLYDNEDNQIIGDKIESDGSNMPENWYDYSEQKWANIVITDGTIQDGQIVDATVTNYYVWIPRYQYKLIDTNQRTDIKFMKGTSTVTEAGYQIPEAFTWIMGDETKELTGYWISKYEMNG